MIPILQGAAAEDWLCRPDCGPALKEVQERVGEILAAVKERGDAALRELAERFGDPPPQEIPRDRWETRLPPEQLQVLERAADRIERFARAMAASLRPGRLEGEEFQAGFEFRPVESVGCYAPGGRHPLPSTALMTGLAARAAGVRHISLICPDPHPAVLWAARRVGADKLYRFGGAQAVAALAYGTETVKKADMVVGPGNVYVTEAKRQLQGVIGIDMLAGPSEVTIIADAQARPDWLALDLLAQAEHDPDARVVLLTCELELARKVRSEIGRFMDEVAYPEFLRGALAASALLVLESEEACIRASDRLAPEHLQLAVGDPGAWKSRLSHYGAVFLGYGATVPFGDYGAGPNHTLPTGRTARFSSGLSPLTFLRVQCWMETGLRPLGLAADTALFAELEGLHGHAAAARGRL